MNGGLDIKHGEAVAMDVLFSSYLSLKRNFISICDFRRIESLISSFNIPVHCKLFDAKMLWSGLSERILHRNGFQHVPLPLNIGHCQFVNDITYDKIKQACQDMQFLSGENYCGH